MNYQTKKPLMTLALQYYTIIKSYNLSKGFTLIEILVVIVIISILSAIALPSFLSQASKARQSEAKQYISNINRSQQSYYLANNTFITDEAEIGKLGIGLSTNTANYTYALSPLANNGVAAIATPKGQYKAYIGGVGLIYVGGATDLVTATTLCESKESGTGVSLASADIVVTTGVPDTGGGAVTCGNQTVAVK